LKESTFCYNVPVKDIWKKVHFKIL